MHLTACRGIISLLEKLGRDGLRLKNWRPLSLLNTDNKVYTKALALRLQKVQPELIDNSQTGFIKGRFMAEGIMKTMEVLQYCNSKKYNAFLISFDFLKAFDTIEWEAMYATLRKFNFGDNFIKMVKIIYKNPLACAYNNGYWSSFLGGLSLHLNHLIAKCMSAPYWQFGTLPIGIFLSNLDSGQLETSLMTSYCHF